MALHDEIETKHERVRQFLHSHHLDGVLLSSTHNFAWFTGGASNYVNTASTNGSSHLLVTAHSRTILSNNIEGPRLLEEEDGIQFFEHDQYPWHDAREQSEVVRKHTVGKRIACDGGMAGIPLLPHDFDLLRHTLLEDEVVRFREVCRDTGEALGNAARTIEPGQSELEIAGLLSLELRRKGLVPIVVLVAVDERIRRFRHPLPTGGRLTRYAELIVCGRRKGLVGAATRSVHFGKVPEEIQTRHQAVMKVDAAAMLGTRAGRPLRDVLHDIRETYAKTGFSDEWQKHHQGGLIGYQAREYLVNPTDQHVAELNQGFAWNPSITGAKSEDTMLLTVDGPEILTHTPDWPEQEIIIGARALPRPEILVR